MLLRIWEEGKTVPKLEFIRENAVFFCAEENPNACVLLEKIST